MNSSDIDSNKNVLIPFHTNLLHKHHGSSLFSNINYSLKQSLENTFTTIFVGPLRERSEFKDDISKRKKVARWISSNKNLEYIFHFAAISSTKKAESNKKKAKNVNFVQSNSLFLTVNSNFKNQPYS